MLYFIKKRDMQIKIAQKTMFQISFELDVSFLANANELPLFASLSLNWATTTGRLVNSASCLRVKMETTSYVPCPRTQGVNLQPCFIHYPFLAEH